MASAWTAQLHSSRLAAHPGPLSIFSLSNDFLDNPSPCQDLLPVLSPSPAFPILRAPTGSLRGAPSQLLFLQEGPWAAGLQELTQPKASPRQELGGSGE